MDCCFNRRSVLICPKSGLIRDSRHPLIILSTVSSLVLKPSPLLESNVFLADLVRIHFHVLFKARSSSTARIALKSHGNFSVCAAEDISPRLTERWMSALELRRSSVQSDSSQLITGAHGPTLAARSLQNLIHTFIIWWLHSFDSLLPVSVRAKLNVNQGSDLEKHECKQMKLRAARYRRSYRPEQRRRRRQEEAGSCAAVFVFRPSGCRNTVLFSLREHQIYMEGA